MNTKVRKSRTKIHTDIITTRIAPEIKQKFEALCLAEYHTPSYVIRDFILEFVRNRTATLNSMATQTQRPKQRPAHEYALRLPTSARPPSQQADENWDDWG